MGDPGDRLEVRAAAGRNWDARKPSAGALALQSGSSPPTACDLITPADAEAAVGFPLRLMPGRAGANAFTWERVLA